MVNFSLKNHQINFSETRMINTPNEFQIVKFVNAFKMAAINFIFKRQLVHYILFNADFAFSNFYN